MNEESLQSAKLHSVQCVEYVTHPGVRGIIVPFELLEHIRIDNGKLVLQLKSEEEYRELQAKLHSPAPKGTSRLRRLGGQSYVGWNIATIESKDGLSEYALIWNSQDDKFDLWQKVYSNPEDPSEFKYQSGDISDKIVHDLKYYIDSQDMWPIIENLVKLARKQEDEEEDE